MKSVSKPYRLAIFNALNGHISFNGKSIKVYDELKSVQDLDTEFILLSTQQSRNVEANNECFIRSASIDIEVITKFGSEVSKDDMDDIEDLIINLLFPDRITFGVTEPSGFQFQEWQYESERTLTTVISQTETIVRKIITITTLITQQ